MLSSIRIQRFKKFQDVEAHLRPFTVLMGENSSGKTTVLQAINLALSSLYLYKLVETDSSSNLVIKQRIRQKGVGLTTLPGMSISDIREVYYAKKIGGGRAKGAGGANIDITDDKNNNYRLQIRSLYGAFNIKCISETNELLNSPDLHLRPPLFISGFVGLLSAEERVFPVAIQDRLRSGQVSAIIRNLLLDTQEQSPQKFEQLKERLQKDFNFYLDNVSFDQKRDLNIAASYSDLCEAQRLSLDFNSSGSGFMQVLQILAPIYRFCPEEASVVLLDEPDAHLHPNLQATLANTLRDIQQELGIQIIISTHSTSIIRAAEPSEVIPISAKEKLNKPLTTSDDVEQQISSRIDTYELGKSVISGKLIFLEDSNISILEAFDKVLGTKCFSGANTVPVLKGRSKDDRIPFQMNKILYEYTGREVEIHFLRDGDGLSEEWRNQLTAYSNNNNVVFHQLERHEIENYILLPSLIHRSLVHKNSSKDIPTKNIIESKIIELLKNTILMRKHNYDDNLEDSIRKTSILLKLEHYIRDFNAIKSASRRLLDEYEKYERLDELIIVGMGKEALKGILSWINAELKLKLSQKDILENLEPSDIPEEIKNILTQLTSKESKPTPTNLPVLLEQEEDEDEIGEEEVDEL